MTAAQAASVLESLASFTRDCEGGYSGAGAAPGFTSGVFATTLSKLSGGACDATSAARLCEAAGSLLVWPGRAWLQAAYRVLYRGFESLGPAEVARLLSGIAAIPHASPGHILASEEVPGARRTPSGADSDSKGSQANDPRLSSSSPHSPSTLPAIGSLTPQSPPDAEASASAAAAPPPDRQPSGGVSTRPPRRLMQRLMGQLLLRSGNGHVNHVADALWAAVRLGFRPPPRWMAAALDLACSEQAVRQVNTFSTSLSV